MPSNQSCCVHLRSDAYSDLLSKIRFFSMVGHLNCCNTCDSLGPNRYWLEVSKKIKHDLVPQGTLELQYVKFESYWKLYFYEVNKIPKTLTGYNSNVPWGTRSCLTFLETSKQYLLGLRLSWVLQYFKCLPGHAEKSYFTVYTAMRFWK